jgi:hypothetical protein
MIKRDTWITQFGKSYASRKITTLPCQAVRPGTTPKHLPLIIIPLGTHQWTPKHLGDMPKAKIRRKASYAPLMGSRSGHSKVG